METNQVYYDRRADEARTAASAATDDRARVAHLEMAARYEDLLVAIGANNRNLQNFLIEAA